MRPTTPLTVSLQTQVHQHLTTLAASRGVSAAVMASHAIEMFLLNCHPTLAFSPRPAPEAPSASQTSPAAAADLVGRCLRHHADRWCRTTPGDLSVLYQRIATHQSLPLAFVKAVFAGKRVPPAKSSLAWATGPLDLTWAEADELLSLLIRSHARQSGALTRARIQPAALKAGWVDPKRESSLAFPPGTYTLFAGQP